MGFFLPSIYALQAFESVARHLSFKEAASELNLTPGAISQKIKKLEDQLETSLFDRTQTRIKLTVSGQEYLPVIRLSLSQISEASRALRKEGGPSTLNVSVTPLFAIKLFIPVLSGFNELHPEITVNTCTSVHLVDFEAENVDMAIRHGLGRYPGLISHRLFSEELVPVCSPKLLDGGAPLRGPEDLHHHTLLHHGSFHDWELWLTPFGLEGIDPTKGPRFSDDGLVIQAAIEGQGVALGRSALVRSDINKGLLVAPFNISMPSQFAYYLVYPQERQSDAAIRIFKDWILERSGLAAQENPL